MFYFKNWERFCESLTKCNVKICTVEHSLDVPTSERFVVLKHDVEASVSNAHKLARIEHKYGICGSYYVQAYLMSEPENIKLLKDMQSWGHEISYHYDVLDANDGDFQAAEKDFAKYLKIFEENGFKFGTICQHGNPIKNRIGYTSNRDFFRNIVIHNRYPDLVDVVVDYSKHTSHKYRYVSDAGYNWNIISEPETNDLHPNVKNVKVGDFKSLSDLVKNTEYSYIISTHPHRWMNKAWRIHMKICVFKVVRMSVKAIRYLPGAELMMNKFYYIAKRI